MEHKDVARELVALAGQLVESAGKASFEKYTGPVDDIEVVSPKVIRAFKKHITKMVPMIGVLDQHLFLMDDGVVFIGRLQHWLREPKVPVIKSMRSLNATESKAIKAFVDFVKEAGL